MARRAKSCWQMSRVHPSFEITPIREKTMASAISVKPSMVRRRLEGLCRAAVAAAPTTAVRVPSRVSSGSAVLVQQDG